MRVVLGCVLLWGVGGNGAALVRRLRVSWHADGAWECAWCFWCFAAVHGPGWRIRSALLNTHELTFLIYSYLCILLLVRVSSISTLLLNILTLK